MAKLAALLPRPGFAEGYDFLMTGVVTAPLCCCGFRVGWRIIIFQPTHMHSRRFSQRAVVVALDAAAYLSERSNSILILWKMIGKRWEEGMERRRQCTPWSGWVYGPSCAMSISVGGYGAPVAISHNRQKLEPGRRCLYYTMQTSTD